MGKSRCRQRAIARALFFFFTLFSIFESPPSGFASALSSQPAPLNPRPFSLIPNQYGAVEEFYDASPRFTQATGAGLSSIETDALSLTEKTIIYIQDAHDSLDAQEHIAKIISHLVKRGIVRTVFEEGYEGKVPTDEYFGFIKNPAVKEKVSYFLMDKLRIGGAEYAHINREKDFELIGADNLRLYEENGAWYRKAARLKKEVSRDLDRFIARDGERAAVLVFGGFHKPNITNLLRRKNLSYLVVSPKISSIDKRHRDYYKHLMTAGHHPFEAFPTLRTARPPDRIFSLITAAQFRESYVNSLPRDLLGNFATKKVSNEDASKSRKPVPHSPPHGVGRVHPLADSFLTTDFPRSELRRNNGAPWSERLLEGVGRFRIDERAHRTPDWHRMNVAGHKLLDRLLERPGPVKADEIFKQVNQKLKDQVLDYGEVNDEVLLQNVTALLDRLVDLELVKKTPQGYDLAVERPIFAIKVNHIRYILRRLAKLLTALEDNERDAEETLRKFIEDYSGAAQHWVQYEMEARDPILKAIALLDSSMQDKLRDFLALPQNVHLLGHLKLVDAIWLMLRKTGRENWLSTHANALVGRNIYYVSSETWLAAGGLGRVGQFHTRALQALAGRQAQMVTIEPYYRDADYSQLPVPVEGLGKKPEPIFEFDLTLWHERSRQWKKVTAQVFKGRNRFGVEIYLIKDKPEREDEEEYYTKYIYRYGPEHGAASWSEFAEFMSKASLKLVKRLEKQKFDEMKQQNKIYKPPVVWGNDGQLGFLPLFKRISDSLEEFSREEWVKRFREDGINFSELKDFEDFFTDPDLDLIRALENRSRGKPDSSTFELKTVRGKGVIEAFLSKGISGAWDHNLVLVERGTRYPETGQEASGTVRIDEETVPEFFKWLDSQDENSKISVVDASSGKVFGTRSQKEILERGIYVSIPTDTRVQVLKLVPTDGEAQSSKDEPVTRASFFYDPGLTESLKTEILNLVPSQLLKWKGKSSDDVVWWVSGEGFYPLERVPGNWQEAGHYLVSSKGRGRFALTLSTTLNEFLEDKFDGRYRYGKGDPYAQFLLENAPHNVLRLNVGEGQIGYFPEAGVPIYNKRYQDPSFAFWFTYHLVPFARRLGYGKIEIEKRWQARRFLEELDFKLKPEETDSNPPVPVWEFDVASAAARSEARSEQPAESRRREAEINSKFKTSAIRLGGSATQSGGQNSKLKSRSETRAEGLEFLTRPRVAIKNGKADLSISFRLDDPGRLRKWRFFVHYGLDQDRAVHWLDLEIPEREIPAKGAGIFEIQTALPLLPERLYRVTVFAEHRKTAAKVWQGAPAQNDATVFISLEDDRFKKANEEARKRIRESLGDFDRFVDAIYELSEIEKIRGIGKLLLEAAGEDQALVHFLNDSHARLETDLKKEEGERTERLKPAYRALRTLGIGEVVIVAAEGPHAVGGGLAKVIEGLPRALADQGVSVTVITLLYDQPRGNMHPSAEDLIRDGFKIEGENMFIAPQPAGEVSISLGPTYQSGTQVTGFQDDQLKSVGRIYRPSVDEAWDGSVRHLFLSDKDLADQLYEARSSRKALEQAIFLSRGALEILREPAFGIQPHIVISNDWPAGFVPVFLKLDPKYQSEKFADAQAIHMIHNLGRAYQGRFFTNEEGVDLWPLLKLPHSEENYRLIADPNDSWLMNLQAAAIRSADALLTVSRDYAGQMLTKAGGEGLEDLFREKEDSFFGISNGIPAGYYRRTFWRLGEQARKESGLPPLVPDFSDESYLEHLFSYKQSVKERVQADYGLAERPDAVLLSMVGRMAEQKGIGLLTEIDSRSGETYLERILKSDERVQFLIGGPPAEGDEAMSRLRAVVKSLMKKYPGRIRGIPERDGEIFTDLIPHPETLRIIFASRFFLMPSRYELGGITQLEALAGGTVPIARNVGGIKSTLEDYSTPGTARRGKAFLFEEFNGYSLFRAAGRALAVTETSDYAILINRAARSGNDWSDRMPKYLALFGRLAGALRFEGEGKKSEGIRFEFLSPLAREIDRMRPRKDDQASEKQDQTGALLKQAIDRPGQNREIDGRSEVRFERLIEGVKTPAVALVDFTDFSEAQVTEFFARAFLNPDRLKLVIYNVKDSNDKRLEPFRRLWKNVRILEGPLEKAWEAQGRLAGNNGQAAIIHFSKGNFSAPFPSRSNRAQPVFSFRYLAAQKQSGLLGAALLYADFVTTGDSERLKKGFEWLGIEKRPGNFFVVSSEYLDRLEREFDQAFVIQIAA